MRSSSLEEEEEDPFACFGDDESDDEKDDKEKNPIDSHVSSQNDEHETCRRRLMEDANARLDMNNNSSDVNNRDGSKKTGLSMTTDQDDDNDVFGLIDENFVLPPTVQMWRHRPPLYLSPKMAVVSDMDGIGGGRGYIATENIIPGTLLLVEEPLFEWPEEQVGGELGLISIEKGILSSLAHDADKVKAILVDLEELHPTKTGVDLLCRSNKRKESGQNSDDHGKHVDENDTVQIFDMIQKMVEEHENSPHLARILKIIKRWEIKGSDNKRLLDKVDIMRIMLALRYNGFASGVYLHYAIFNHSDDTPNCVKFMPENLANGKSGYKYNTKTTKQKNILNYSEVRTTRYIKKGEELTLHYLDPREVSHAHRRWHLWDQHRFDIGPNMKSGNERIKTMELVNNKFPVSSLTLNEDADTYHTEQAVTQLEELCNGIKTPLIAATEDRGNVYHALDESRKEAVIEAFERAKALELAAEELIQATIRNLNNENHIILIRCYRLHLDSSELLLRVGNNKLESIYLSNIQQINIMCRFVPNAKRLLSLQIQLLGDCHIDVARTYQDIAQVVATLLSVDPKRLFALGLDGMKSFNQCSFEEHRCQKEFERISTSYPRDVHKFLGNSSK